MRSSIAARNIAILSAIVAVIVLFGWLADVDAVKGLFPGFATMKFNTAFCFLLSAITLWFLNYESSVKIRHGIAPGSAALVMLVAAVTLIEYMISWNVGIDELFARDFGTEPALGPGRMSAATAFNFLLLGAALLSVALRSRRPGTHYLSQLLALFAGLGGLIGLQGYLFGPESLYRFLPYASMALHTSLLFVLLGLGTLLVQYESGFMSVLSSDHVGGSLARRILPITLISPILVGWALLHGVEAGYYDERMGVAIFASSGIVAVSVIVWLVARHLNELHEKLQHRNRLYAFLSQSNQLIVRSKERQSFLDEVCRIATHLGEFEIAWIGIYDPESGMVRVTSSAGDSSNFLKGMSNINIHSEEWSGGPISEAIKTGKPAIVQDIGSDPRRIPWRDRAKEQKLFAYAGFPIFVNNTITGVLCLHADESGYFGTEEIELLTEVAMDVSFALTQMEADIRRKQAESRAGYLAAIVQSSGDAIVGKDLSGIVTSWNEGARRLFGYSPEEMVGRSIRVLIPVDRLPEEDNILRQISLGQRVEHFETVRQRRDGSLVDVSVSVSPIRDASGKVIGASKVARDITERAQAERKLRETLDRLEMTQRIVDAAPSGILIADASGSILLVNPELERIFGYKRHELLGKSIDLLVPESLRQHHPGLRNSFMKRPSARPMGAGRDLFGQRKDGSQVPVEIGLTPISSEHGMLVLATIVDVTDRKRVERELELRREELERSNKDLEQFAYVSSHDLQEPLRAVAGCVQLLLQRYESKLDERGIEFINHAVDGANRMQSLIDGLLTYSRVGSRTARRRSIDANEALDAALTNLEMAIKEADAEVTSGNLPVVVTDPTQLILLFQNLVGNGLKFRRKDIKTKVRIAAYQTATHWQFSVEDNGIGIEEQFYERIFGVFQRLHTRKEHPGTGIGLAVCKRIVEQAGGKIWLNSRYGEGTTFFFTLPDQPESAKLGDQSETPESVARPHQQ